MAYGVVDSAGDAPDTISVYRQVRFPCMGGKYAPVHLHSPEPSQEAFLWIPVGSLYY